VKLPRNLFLILVATPIIAVLTWVGIQVVEQGQNATITPTGKSPGSGRVLFSYYAYYPPNVDGNLDDWDDTGAVRLDVTTASYKQNDPISPADLSGEIRSQWNETYLYLAIRVNDDLLIWDSGSKVWLDDSIELAFNTDDDPRLIGPLDHQYNVRVNGDVSDRADLNLPTSQGVIGKVQRENRGYTAELALPWSALYTASLPISGTFLGFNWALNDDDQDGKRTWLIWSGTQTASAADQFGRLVLIQPPLPPTPTPQPTVPTPTPGPQSVTLVLQQGLDGYTGVQDTYITSWYAKNNYSKEKTLALRAGQHSSLIRFADLSRIPTDARIMQATLSLYVTSRTNSQSLTVQAYPLLRPWSVDQVTWEQATTAFAWSKPGANDTTNDREATVVASWPLTTLNTWIDLNVTSLVASWVANPGKNVGLLLQAVSVGAVQYDLVSSDAPQIPLRPRLTIRYETTPPAGSPTVTPTPGSPTPTPAPVTPTPVLSLEQRVTKLEGEVRRLRQLIEELRRVLERYP